MTTNNASVPVKPSARFGSLTLVACLGGLLLLTASSPAQSARLTVNTEKPGPVIEPDVYGHFAEHLGRCIYEGIWVGENSSIENVRGIRTDTVQALKKINVPVLRWPGGCFADDYHWKDGIGPREQRPMRINRHWGRVPENNHFGTHEFLDLCEQIGCEAYIAGNVGSGTPWEMQQWLEYLTYDGDSEMANLRRANGRDKPWKIKYFGVGNENWGCGGNMRPEYYADVYLRFREYCLNYSGRTKWVACGPGGKNYRWLEVLMERAGRLFDGIGQHYYVFSGHWGDKGEATKFSEAEWIALMQRSFEADEIIRKDIEIMDRFDPRGRIGLYLDEWGIWWNPRPGDIPGFLYQQNTLRDALSAAVFFNIMHQHAARLKMANIAQTVNVLQAMILTDGPRMITTPTYHVFDLFQVHRGARLLPMEIEAPKYAHDGKGVPSLSASASRDEAGRIHLTLAHLNPVKTLPVSLRLKGVSGGKVEAFILSAPAMNAHNTFEQPGAVQPTPFTGAKWEDSELTLELPSKSLVRVTIEP